MVRPWLPPPEGSCHGGSLARPRLDHQMRAGIGWRDSMRISAGLLLVAAASCSGGIDAAKAREQVDKAVKAYHEAYDRADIDKLRGVGFSDLNIADIALAASYRNFMSRYFDAVGATVVRSRRPAQGSAGRVGRTPTHGTANARG